MSFWISNDFNDFLDMNRQGRDHREITEMDERKADALVNMRKAREGLSIVHLLEENQMRMNDMWNHIEDLQKDNSKISKELKEYKQVFWKIEKCDAKSCEKWNVWSHKELERLKCKACYWTEYKIENKHIQRGLAIDLAAEWSKDKTCIVTFKKNEDWTLEVINTKIVKPIKK